MRLRNADRLSELPEEIVSHILSLMPTKFAVRTSVLSKRWRYAWTLITNLDFENREFERSFELFVDRVLESCKASEINLFRLSFSYSASQINLFRLGFSYGADAQMKVSNWIDKAVKLNVRELEISCNCTPPLSLFTCKTLSILRINTGAWKCPCPVNLPSLKTLEIVAFCEDFDHVLQLVSGSPTLECLSLGLVSGINYGADYIFNIPNLKRLKLLFVRSDSSMHRVVLNLPNLEYLCVGGWLGSSFVMEDVSSLVEASISFTENDSPHLWVDLLKGLSGVKSLSLQFFPSLPPLPTIFTNLEHLELKYLWNSEEIAQVLESCPILKHVYIETHVGSGGFEPKSVPACMLTNLTTIKFSNRHWSEDGIEFLEFMLGNAKALKTVTIALNESTTRRLRARMMKLKRASRCCEVAKVPLKEQEFDEKKMANKQSHLVRISHKDEEKCVFDRKQRWC